MPDAAPRRVMFHRHRYAARAVLFDENLDLRSVEDLQEWSDLGIAFVVIDSETGQDVTRVLMAKRWDSEDP